MKNINIRFEDNLHTEIKEAAEQDKRSFNGEVQWLLNVALIARARELRLAAETAQS
jgi:hypothetical protein